MHVKIIILSLVFFTIFELITAVAPPQSSNVGEPSECSICLAQLSIPRENNKNKIVTVLKCNHAFHTKCIQKWIKRSNTCPPCRSEVLEGQVFLINSKQKQEHPQQSAQPSTSRRQTAQMNSGPTRQPPVAVQRANSFGQERQNNFNPSNSLQQRPAIQSRTSPAGTINLNATQQRSDNHANTSGHTASRHRANSFGQVQQINPNPSNSHQQRPVIQLRPSPAGPINLNAPQQRSADKRANTSAGPINLNAAQQRSDNHANTSGQMRQTLPNRPQQTNVTQSGISNTNTLNTSLMANSSRVQQQRPAGQAENDIIRTTNFSAPSNSHSSQVRQNSAREQSRRVAQSNTANTNTKNSMVRRNHNQQHPASTSNINELNSSQVRRNPNQQQPASTSNINELNSSQVRRNPNQQQPASTSNINELNSNAAELDRLLALQLHNKMKQQMRLRDEGFARRTQKQEDQAAELHSLEVARAMQEEEYERGIMNSSPEDDHHGNQNSSESLEIITTELNDDDCAICLSSLSDGNEKGPMKMAVPCNHFFHRDCINVWLNTSKNCPICRAPVNAVNDVGQSSQGGASRNDEQSIQFPDESTLPDQLYGVASAFSQGISSFVNWLLESNTNELPHYYEQIALLQSATIPTKLLMEEENGQMKIVMIVDIDLDSDHQQYLTVIDSNQEIHTLYIGRNGQNCMTFRDNNRRLNISRIIAIMSDDN